MTFQPVVPAGGIVGWRFLQRTYEAQFQAFSASAANERDTEYFLENIQNVKTAEDLVSDRRLLQVALGAFGLEDDLTNRYFLLKLLSDGTTSDDALANRLADRRYRAFSEAFGLGPGEIRKTDLLEDMETVSENSLSARFESSVGKVEESMRIALYTQRALKDLAEQPGSETKKWYDLMSLPPLRSMMETSLGLPSSFGQLDIDNQLSVFRDKLESLTGSPNLSQYSNSEAMAELTDTYLARNQIAQLQSSNSPAQTALILLGAGN
ncbi:MAG: DUF1217 domain-containing protein [Ruegeria sp.]